jgi:hypothetical protein
MADLITYCIMLQPEIKEEITPYLILEVIVPGGSPKDYRGDQTGYRGDDLSYRGGGQE